MEGRKEWTTTERRVLIDNAHYGIDTLCDLLPNRSRSAIKDFAKRNRISLRRPGVTSGLMLGQPRSVSLAGTELREDILAGVVDPNTIAVRVSLERRNPDLCPRCSSRPIRVSTSGLCNVCHMKALTEGHKEAMEELVAQRGYDLSKKQRQRVRDWLEGRQR